MSTSRFIYQHVDEVERLEHYRPGGYHPLRIGDILHGRYRIVHKLGHGSFSTIWLARDQHSLTFVAVKIGIANSDHHDVDVLSRISGPIPTWQKKPRSKYLLPLVLDTFCVHGPNGTHFCFTTDPARCSLANTQEASNSGLFQLQVARALVAQLVIAVTQIHEHKYVHGGQYSLRPYLYSISA
jgi:serine/threonine protein kinase